MLKNKADLKTLLFAALISACLVWNWTNPSFNWLSFSLACFGGVMVSSLVHNHVHVNIYRSRFLNAIHDYWLTLFYGYPVFAWIATHNMNHHVHTNREGDFAPSYIHSEKNNLFTLLSYPTISGMVQQKVNYVYLQKLWHKDRAKCLYYISQGIVLFLYIGAALIVDWKKAILYIVIPQQISLNTVLIFNYLQHIHCDEESQFNHSRNVVGPVMNFFLLNNGYHTVHHMKPLAHWSELKGLHQKIAHKIDPRLNEPSLLWMIIKMYFLAPIFPSLASVNMRAARMNGQPESGPAGQTTQKLATT